MMFLRGLLIVLIVSFSCDMAWSRGQNYYDFLKSPETKENEQEDFDNFNRNNLVGFYTNGDDYFNSLDKTDESEETDYEDVIDRSIEKKRVFFSNFQRCINKLQPVRIQQIGRLSSIPKEFYNGYECECGDHINSHKIMYIPKSNNCITLESLLPVVYYNTTDMKIHEIRRISVKIGCECSDRFTQSKKY